MSDVPEIASETHLKKMINNRDYSVLVNYNPPTRCFGSEHSNQTFSHDLWLLEIRSVLLSCIYYSALVVREFSDKNIKSTFIEVNGLNSNNELKSEYVDQLHFHFGKLKDLYARLESDPPTPIPMSVFGSFFGSKLFSLRKSNIMLTIVKHLIEFVQIISSTVSTSGCMDDELIENLKVNASELTNGFEKAIDYCQCTISKTINEIDSSLKLEGRKEVLEILTNMIDVSNIIIHEIYNKYLILLLFLDIEYFMYICVLCDILYKKFTKQSCF